MLCDWPRCFSAAVMPVAWVAACLLYPAAPTQVPQAAAPPQQQRLKRLSEPRRQALLQLDCIRRVRHTVFPHYDAQLDTLVPAGHPEHMSSMSSFAAAITRPQFETYRLDVICLMLVSGYVDSQHTNAMVLLPVHIASCNRRKLVHK